MLKNMAMELYYVNFHSHATHNKQKIMPDTLVDKCAYMDRTNNQKKKKLNQKSQLLPHKFFPMTKLQEKKKCLLA